MAFRHGPDVFELSRVFSLSYYAVVQQEVPDSDELYDRRADPFQLHNIIEEQPDKAAELLRTLKLHIGELKTL